MEQCRPLVCNVRNCNGRRSIVGFNPVFVEICTKIHLSRLKQEPRFPEIGFYCFGPQTFRTRDLAKKTRSNPADKDDQRAYEVFVDIPGAMECLVYVPFNHERIKFLRKCNVSGRLR